MTAPELSAEERAIVDRFEAAPDLPESWAASNSARCTCGHLVRHHVAGKRRCPVLTFENREVLGCDCDSPDPVRPTANAWAWGGTDMTPRRP
jgi:hypothetical protein